MKTIQDDEETILFYQDTSNVRVHTMTKLQDLGYGVPDVVTRNYFLLPNLKK